MAALLLLGVAATGAPAQEPARTAPDQPAVLDSGGDQEPARLQRLRQQVEMRFGQIVQTQLQLSESQMQQLRTAMRANQDRRRALARRDADVRRAMAAQMQPGVAADQDSLNRLLEAASRVRVEMAQSDDQFQRDLVFLTPVQRVRLMMLMRRFEERIQEIRRRNMQGRMMGPQDGQGPGAAGQRPRVRPRQGAAPPQSPRPF